MPTSRGLSDRLMDIGPVRRHSLIAFISSIGVTVIGFFATIYIAHNAGATALGGFFLLLAYVGIIGLFTDGGISGAALQRISEGDSPEGVFFCTCCRSVYTPCSNSYYPDCDSANFRRSQPVRPVFMASCRTRCFNRGRHHFHRGIREWESRDSTDCRPRE